jgi:hypothetical protein
VLDNVLYARAYTSEHQYELLDYVAAKFHEEAGVFKLLVSYKATIYVLQVLRNYVLFINLDYLMGTRGSFPGSKMAGAQS